MFRIVRHENVTTFLDRARSWLLAAEAENNLLLGVVGQLSSGRHGYTEPVYLGVVEDSGNVVGCAFRTPPFGIGLTNMTRDCIPDLVSDVRQVYATLPSAVGPESSVAPFATEWSRLNGCTWRIGMRQRIYELTEVRWPANRTNGDLRLATQNDLPLVDAWAEHFVRESGVPANLNENLARTLIDEACLYLWEDGHPRCMAAARGPTPNGVRIGFVYTSPESRRKGYASMCVASLSQLQLDCGKSFCFLYTDLANPTSNSIYQEIGYSAVADSIMCLFDAESS